MGPLAANLTATSPTTPPGGTSTVERGMIPLTSSPTPQDRASAGPPPAQPTAGMAADEKIPEVRRPTGPPAETSSSNSGNSKAVSSIPAAVDSHRIQPGDSLSSLAQTYYGDTKYAQFLAEANPEIRNPHALRVGSIVKIPTLPTGGHVRDNADRQGKSLEKGPTSDPGGKRTYVVKPGDSFYSIAKAQLGNAGRWKELLSLNSATVHGDPTALQPGQKLVLPES